MGAAHSVVHSTHALCLRIAIGDEAEPVYEGKSTGGGEADPIASNSIIF